MSEFPKSIKKSQKSQIRPDLLFCDGILRNHFALSDGFSMDGGHWVSRIAQIRNSLKKLDTTINFRYKKLGYYEKKASFLYRRYPCKTALAFYFMNKLIIT